MPHATDDIGVGVGCDGRRMVSLKLASNGWLQKRDAGEVLLSCEPFLEESIECMSGTLVYGLMGLLLAPGQGRVPARCEVYV